MKVAKKVERFSRARVRMYFSNSVTLLGGLGESTFVRSSVVMLKFRLTSVA
jgi:hypothetical protein